MLKQGERVRVCDEAIYNKELYKNCIGKSSVGRTGTVQEIRYNKNMACYGKQVEVVVKMDDCRYDNTSEIWYENELELII